MNSFVSRSLPELSRLPRFFWRKAIAARDRLTGVAELRTELDREIDLVNRLEALENEVEEFKEHDHDDDDYVDRDELEEEVGKSVEEFFRDQFDPLDDSSFTGRLDEYVQARMSKAFQKLADLNKV